jgi:O-antigen/teichoic acid export membrane protein
MPRSSPAAAALTGETAAPAPATLVPPRRLAINFLFLSGGESAAKLLTFASFSYLARILSPGNYGFLEFALAVMVFFTLPADLGLGAYGAREIARDRSRAARLLHEITGLRLALALCSMAVLAVFILVLRKPFEVKLLLSFYGVSLLSGPFLLQWFFQAHDQMQWVGAASIVRQLGFAALIFAACRRGVPLAWLGLIECGSVFAVAVFCVYVTRVKMGFAWPWPDLRIRALLSHMGEAVPIGLTEVAWAFMWYFPTVLLGLILSGWPLGWFGASHRALMALHTFVWLYFFNLLPSISRCTGQPREHLLRLMDRSVRFAAWTGLFLAAALTVLADNVLRIVFGWNYAAAGSTFSILVWMLPVAMLSGHHRYILIAYRRQKQLLHCTTVSAVVAVVLGLALVPLFRGLGAAWALLIANIVNFVLVYFVVRKLVVEVPVHRQLAVPLLSLAAAAVVYFALLHWNFWIALAAGTAVYCAGLLWSDGRELISFVRVVAGRPVENAA